MIRRIAVASTVRCWVYPAASIPARCGQAGGQESPGGMKLFLGKGDEPDTIGDKAVLVYDSDKFLYSAEVYHQFHNDFMDPYARHNAIQQTQIDSGKLKNTGCPYDII